MSATLDDLRVSILSVWTDILHEECFLVGTLFIVSSAEVGLVFATDSCASFYHAFVTLCL